MINLQIFVVMMAILIPICHVTASNCTQNPVVKCSIRYDIMAGNAEVFRNWSSCPTWYCQSPICDANLVIRYYHIPPYMTTLSNGSVDGIIPGLLKIVLMSCCGMCTRLTYLKPFKSAADSIAWFYNASSYSIMMPALATSKTGIYFGNPFVKLMDTPGVVYVTIDNSAEEFGRKLLASIGGTWPLLIITLLLTTQGGVYIWLSEQWKNPDEFPRPFVHGTVEGSWWAFVSMTTVGYGDKAPRSIPGRIFAIFWITIGVAIIGMFTASLSSSLTQAAIPEKSSLQGLKIGYLQYAAMSYEANIIYREEGTAQYFEKVQDMIEALRANQIQGILMDSLALRYHWSEFEKSGLKLARKTDIVNSETEIGIMFSSSALQNWATFLQSFIEGNKDASSRLLREAVNGLKVKNSIQTATAHGSQSTGQSRGYDYMLIFCAVSCAVALLIGFGFYLLRKFYLSKKVLEANNVHEMQIRKDGLEDTVNQISGVVETLKGTIATIQDELSMLRAIKHVK